MVPKKRVGSEPKRERGTYYYTTFKRKIVDGEGKWFIIHSWRHL